MSRLNKASIITSVSLIDQAIVSVINFSTGIIIGRLCSNADFGLYTLGISIVFIVIDIQAALVSTPYMVESPRIKGLKLLYFTGSSLLQQLILSLLVILCIFLGMSIFPTIKNNPNLKALLYAVSFAILFMMLRENIRRICFAALKIWSVLIIDTAVAIIQISSIIFIALRGTLSAINAFVLIGLSCLIISFVWLFANRNSYRLSLRQARLSFNDSWRISKWILGGAVLWAIGINLYPWIISYFHGISTTGIWGACLGVASIVNPVSFGLQSYVGPKLSHIYVLKNLKIMKTYINKTILLFVYFFLPFLLTILIFGDTLLTRVYGNKYQGNLIIIILLSTNIVVMSIIFTLSRALIILNKADTDFLINMVSTIILLFVGIWLVKYYSLLGAAISLLLANVAGALVRYPIFCSAIKKIRNAK